MTIQEYSINAEALCEAIEGYDYPAVTYDFEPREDFDDDPYRRIDHCKCKLTKSYPEYKTHRECMREVEKKIHAQLLSQNTDVVKDGLSNILYWGMYRMGFKNVRVADLRSKVTDHQLNRFKGVVRRLRGPAHPGLVAIRGRVNNKTDNMPQFTRMPFVSKIRMFLDPVNYPVLDTKISTLANLQHTPTLPLQGLKGLAITAKNEKVYENWASWCREIAHEINSDCNFPYKDLRAVDVERGFFSAL